MAHIYTEVTDDKGYTRIALARDNRAEYVLTSARMHDLYAEYIKRYHKIPAAKWYHRHAQFKERKV